MEPPESPRPRWYSAYQTAVLGASALVIVGLMLLVSHIFQSTLANPNSVSVGVQAIGQVVGATSPHGPAPAALPGLVGTPTPSPTPSPSPTGGPTFSPTATITPTPTQTPDVRFYSPARAKTLLAQAQTSYGAETSAFDANVTNATRLINGKKIPPGATFSFNAAAGPYEIASGYQPLTSSPATDVVTQTIPTVESGITQVSTTLFQAVFWAGLKIVERHTHPVWLSRYGAGSSGQRGLDADVGNGNMDLRFENNTNDWIRIEATAQSGNVTVSIYGADPGWSVNPNVSQPTNIVQPPSRPVVQIDPAVPPGQQLTLSPARPGFDVSVNRAVVRQGVTIDRYSDVEHYKAQPEVIAKGPSFTPTPQPSPTPQPESPTPTVSQSGPTHLAGLDPSAFVLPNGQIKVPLLVGLSEAEAQGVINAVGLRTTYANYQGPGDVPPSILNSVPVGAVLSQSPLAGSAVPRGTIVYIAIRKP